MSLPSFCERFQSSIMRKQVMGLTGLALCGFLVGHLAGNCLIYFGPEPLNKYGHALTSTPLIYVAEAGLIVLFLTHLALAFKLTLENKSARPQKYYAKTRSGRGTNLASATMPLSGLVILAFVVLHILFIKYGPVYYVTYDGVEMRDLYRLLVEYFEKPYNVVWYVFAVCVLGVHVAHGLWSAFQSLGLNHPTYTPKLRCAAKAFGLLVAFGYGAFPLFFYFQGAQ